MAAAAAATAASLVAPPLPLLSIVVTTRPESDILAALRRRWRANCRLFAPAACRGDGGAQSVLLHLLRCSPMCAAAERVDDAYFSHFDAAAPSSLQRTHRLLSILIAARLPPSMAQLEALGVRDACTSLPGWGFLFHEREHCVHLLHRSLAEWLTDAARSGRFAADVAAGHAQWATHLGAQLRAWLQPQAGCTLGAAPPKGSYVYAHALPHLDAAGRGEDAKALLMRLPWLQATLHERGLYALLSDVRAHMTGSDTLQQLWRTLQLAAPGLQGADAAEALPAQLLGRLTDVEAVGFLCDEARCFVGSRAWLRPLRPSLRQPVGPLQLQLESRGAWVEALLALPDGRRVVSGARDKTLRVWNAASGECERILEGHAGNINTLCALHGSCVASGSADDTARVWDIDAGECDAVLTGHTAAITCLTELSNGRLASGSADSSVRVWRLDAATPGDEACCAHIVLRGHTDGVMCLLALDDGERVLSGSADATLRLWDARSGACVRTFVGHEGKVKCVAALGSDGRRVVSASWDASLRIWNTATGACERTLEGHTGAVQAMLVLRFGVPGGDAELVVSGAHDRTLRVWDARTGACARVLTGHTSSIRALLALDGARVASASVDGTLRLWDACSGTCERVLEGHTDMVSSLVSLGASGRVVSASADATLRVWHPASTERERAPEGHADMVACLVATDDGRVVSGSRDDTLRVWDGVCERILAGHTGAIESLVALQGGRVASGSADATLRLWHAASGACERTLEGHTDGIDPLVALGDGRIVSGSLDTTLRVWHTHTGVCERTLSGHAGAVTSLVALDSGGLVASGSDDRTVRLWCVATGACTRTLEGHADTVQFLASLGGGRLLSGSWDKTLRVWNAATGECERTVSLLDRHASRALLALPRVHMPGGAPTMQAVSRDGSCLTGAGVARTYVDGAIGASCCITGTAVVAVGTRSGAVHFFCIVPAAV